MEIIAFKTYPLHCFNSNPLKMARADQFFLCLAIIFNSNELNSIPISIIAHAPH